MKTKVQPSILISNKKSLFDYEIIEEYEAGIRLLGWEIKSLRGGQANLKWSHIVVGSGRALLMGCHISEYRNNTTSLRIDPKRDRELLLKASEIIRLTQKVKEMGATIVPIEIYSKGNLFKIRIALARGRKKWEKKQVLKERDLDRENHNIRI